MADPSGRYSVVVIGSGFGGTMTALPIARAFKKRNKGEKLLMLERGTWWTTPVATVADREVKTYDFLKNTKKQPVQFWSSQNGFWGLVDIFTRCFRRSGNQDGLYEMTWLGKHGFLGIFGKKSDGVSIIRAAGVGGGSLVYSNITIRPPDFVLDDPRWPITWSPNHRCEYFQLARDAIGVGVLNALDQRDGRQGKLPAGTQPAPAVNTGLSNIAARTARLDPHWHQVQDPIDPARMVKQLRPSPLLPPPAAPAPNPDAEHRHWIDRARTFQTAVSEITPDFGNVDSSINDLPIEPGAIPNYSANYCERQGRCNVGCLPGARHTLNKQLMAAVLGKPPPPPPAAAPPPPPFQDIMSIEPLADVDVIEQDGDGYRVRYFQRNEANPSKGQWKTVRADRVVVAAGCVGTNEIMLRSKATLGGLSDKVGFGFSTNGDYIAFLEETKERVSLTRGPVTTSFGHFNTQNPLTGGDPKRFHTLEDQGVPPAMAAALGRGIPFIRSLAKNNTRFAIFWAAVKWFFWRLIDLIRAPFLNSEKQQDVFKSNDEISPNMMCVVGMGREDSLGHFRLGGSGESSLRVARTDGAPFQNDAIFTAIRDSLKKVAKKLSDKPDAEFENPFLSAALDAAGAAGIVVSHPLGGCSMAKTAADGVVDELGRVFDTTKGPTARYPGLYIADAAIIPTALGVNPSLTISAVALRIADNIIAELPS